MARDGVCILVTSASGANGNGYGAVLGFGPESDFTGPFSSDPRIADPRGLSLDPPPGPQSPQDGAAGFVAGLESTCAVPLLGDAFVQDRLRIAPEGEPGPRGDTMPEHPDPTQPQPGLSGFIPATGQAAPQGQLPGRN